MKRVLILDGYNLIYRARYSSNLKGEYSTVFSFFRSIRPLIEKFNPDFCYFVLEGRPVARLENDPNYKGQRVYTDDDGFREQRKKIIEVLKTVFPFIVTRHSDYECDDVINYIANEKHKKDKTTIVSSDTDFIQSINENNSLYNPVSKKFIEKKEFNYIEWKALVGDKSDNIIGFKGIGNKKALALLSDKQKFENFISIKENKEKFENNKFMIEFHDLKEESKNISYHKPNNIDWKNLKIIFNDMKFTSIINKEKTWEKYLNTFKNLERNINYVD